MVKLVHVNEDVISVNGGVPAIIIKTKRHVVIAIILKNRENAHL